MSLVQLRPEAPPHRFCGGAYAGIAHPVERHLAKVEVASSSLVARSIVKYSRGCLQIAPATVLYRRRHSQVVRQRTANPRFPGSNPGDASRKGTSFVYKAKDVPFHSLSKRKRLSCCIYIVRMTAEHYMSAVGASIARPVFGSRKIRIDNSIRRCCDSPIISCTADGQDCRPYKVY